MTQDDRAAWSPLERGAGLVIGLADIPPLTPAPRGATARESVEEVVGEALRRPPCVISFSGGRDSSAILAVAAHVARRDGLPLPVPVSLTFPECASSQETEWQEVVVRHLDLPDWERPTFSDELDILGPIAAQVLRRHGVQWPFNAFFHVPILELARGGSVLSGAGGDEAFSSGWAWGRENLVLQRRRPPRPLDPVRVCASVAPKPVRAAFLRMRERSAHSAPRPPWMRPAAFSAIAAEGDRVADAESLSFSRSVRRALWRTRSRLVGTASMQALATERGVAYNAPFFDARFLSALVRERGWRVFDSRTAAMDHLFGDLLPTETRARSGKAWFDTAFFNRHARAFVAKWDGSGVDAAYVDPNALRVAWLTEDEPDARTYALLQAAWLAGQG